LHVEASCRASRFAGKAEIVNSPLFQLARELVRFDPLDSFIVNPNHGIMRAAVEICIADCVAYRVWLAIPQPTGWQRIGD
jgi:hypothetical protein